MRELAGDILHVDLSRRTSWVEPIPRDRITLFLGGRGLNATLLWDLLKPGADPLGPDNPLIFGTGLLTGTEAPSSGRTTVTCRSPATGFYLKTNGGGHWGLELKYSGFGHVVIHGQADRPVYLFIHDGQAEIRDAEPLWGKDTRETDRAIKADLGDEDVQVACIGPAGERLVKFAAIMFSVFNAAGRGGAGAVMGSKKLKAIAVKGTGYVRPVQPENFHAVANRCRESLMAESGFQGLGQFGTSGSVAAVNELNVLASYNFRQGHIDDVHTLTGQHLTEAGYLKRRVACGSCIIACHRYSGVKSGPFSGAESGGPEYESFAALGAGCGLLDTDAVIRANELCNILGLDTISCGGVIQWTMECWEKGLLGLKDLDGLEVRWGNGAAVVEMVRRIAYREGFGDVLAEGVRTAAKKVGGDSWKWAVEAKGLEQSRVDTRSAKAYALAFAVNPRGPDHLATETFAEFGASPEARALMTRLTGGDPKCQSPLSTGKRGQIVRWHEDCYAATDALGFCAFTSTALFGITPELMAMAFSAATGLATTEDELMLAGRRTVTLEKCVNVREGATREHDVLPWRMMHEASPDWPEAEVRNSPEELAAMLDDYYALHDWDPKTSWPRRKTLEGLGLRAVADELAGLGRLPD